MTEPSMTFGNPDEWAHFSDRHRLFFERFPNLKKATQTAFERKGTTDKPVDRIVFFFGRHIWEEFLQILLLCANGYGQGANALLRGMYERAVTTRFLAQNPDQSEAFLDYYWVVQRKLANAVIQNYGPNILPQDKVDEGERNYKSVKGKYMVPDCAKCGTERLNHSWTRLDFVSMARQTDELRDLVVPGYHFPTQDSHATVRFLLSGVKDIAGERLAVFDGGPDRDKVDKILMNANLILINILDLQRTHFGLTEMENEIEACRKDFVEIW